jgi:hypothetical protein
MERRHASCYHAEQAAIRHVEVSLAMTLDSVSV